MDIGSTDPTQAPRGADLADRVRSAHEEADQSEQTPDGAHQTGPAGREAVDEVGTRLRADLESLVVDVVTPGRSEPDDLLGEAVEAIVDERIEHEQLPGGEQYRDQVVEQLRADPVVVSELDDILQTIARDLARGGD